MVELISYYTGFWEKKYKIFKDLPKKMFRINNDNLERYVTFYKIVILSLINVFLSKINRSGWKLEVENNSTPYKECG